MADEPKRPSSLPDVSSVLASIPLGLGLRSYLQKTKFGEVLARSGQPVMTVDTPVSKLLAGAQTSATTKSYGKRAFRALEELAGMTEGPPHTTLPADVVLNTLRDAAAHADTTGAATRAVQRRFAQTTSMKGAEIIQDVIGAFRTSPTVHLRRTAALFADNLKMLQARQAQGLSLEFRALERLPIGIHETILRPSQLGNPIISQNLKGIREMLGGHIGITRRSRPELEGGVLEVKVWGSSKLGKFKGSSTKPQIAFDIPLAFGEGKNLVRSGRTQQSLYAAGQFAEVSFDEVLNRHVIKGLKSYDEWASTKALDHLVMPLMEKSARGETITRKTIQAQQAIFRDIIARRKDWMLPEGIHEGAERYTEARSQILRLFEGDKPVSATTMSSILKQGGIWDAASQSMIPLFPGHSANQMTHGVFSMVDWASQATLFPGAWPHERPVLQPLRKEWALTEVGKEALRGRESFKKFGWARPGGPFMESSATRTMFVGNKDILGGLHQKGFSPEGMVWVSRSQMLPMEEALTPLKVSRLAPEFADVLEKSKWSVNKVVPAGTVLGYDLDGKAVVLEQETRLLEAIRHKDRLSSDYVVFHGAKSVEHSRYAALWNLKSMAEIKTTDEMASTLQGLGVNLQAGKPIQAIAPLADLVKNQAIFNQQMSTSIWEHLEQNYRLTQRNLRGGLSSRVKEFVQDPRTYLQSLETRASAGGVYKQEVIFREMLGLAREGRLRASQMGEVFGALPQALGLDVSTPGKLQASWAEKVGAILPGESLNILEAQAIAQERPVNPANFFMYGGPGAQGVGKQGTIEPRMIENFRGPQWGGLGADLEVELAERMGARYPHRLAEQGILGNALQSLREPGKREGTAYTPEDILAMSQENRQAAYQEGFNLRVKGFGDVAVPSETTLKQLASYKKATGEVVRPELAKNYRDFVGQAYEYTQKNINKDIFGESVDTLKQQVATAYTQTVSGKDALMRGRVPGSRYLTSVATAHGEAAGISEFHLRYIPKKQMLGMARELEDLYGAEYAQNTLREFESGGVVPGVEWRHPGIGPYNPTPVGFKLMEGAQDDVVGVPERFYEGKWRKLGSTGDFTPLPKALRLSSAIGLGEDFDKDASTSMVAGPHTKEKVRQLLGDASWVDKNLEYQIQRQLLTVKSGSAEGMSIRDLMGSAAGKLRIPKESLGLLSTELSKAKAALLYEGGEASKTISGQTFLEWWEQTPISGKHVKPGEEGKLVNLFGQATEALRTSNAPEMMRLTSEIFGRERMEGLQGAILNEGIELQVGGETRQIGGMGFENMVDYTMQKNKSFRQAAPGSLAADIMRRIETKGFRSVREVEGYFGSTQKSTFQNWLPRVLGGKGTMATISSKVNAMRNKMGAVGKGMLEHAKPLALGFAAAVGIATVLSRPGKALEETDMIPPAPSTNSGTGGANIGTNIHPEDHVGGMPTTSNPTQGVNRSMVSPGGSQPPVRLVIRGNSPGGTNYSRLSGQLGSATGGQVNAQVSDQRRSLTPQRLASILERG